MTGEVCELKVNQLGHSQQDISTCTFHILVYFESLQLLILCLQHYGTKPFVLNRLVLKFVYKVKKNGAKTDPCGTPLKLYCSFVCLSYTVSLQFSEWKHFSL